MMVQVPNIKSCFMTRVGNFVLHSRLTWMQIQQFCCVSCWWCTHKNLLCEKKEGYSWRSP